MRLSLGAALLTAVALSASACGSANHGAIRTTVSSSRFILGGAVRCTATLTTTVQVGHELGVSISFRNVSKRTVTVVPPYGGLWVVVRSSDGTRYDSRVLWENALGPPPLSISLQPGAATTRHLRPGLRVRWAGPLLVTPGCDLNAAPPVRVAVASPGLPASATEAVNDVVAATGHLLDHCRPRTSGVSVVGRIDPPSGTSPPLQARCSISLRREDGFYAAQVLVVTPPDLQGVHVDPTYEVLSGTNFRNRNTGAIAWQFVVTREGAISVYSAHNETARPGDGRAPDWTWSSSGPQSSGSAHCGFSGGGSGGVDGPDVYFVSGCGR